MGTISNPHHISVFLGGPVVNPKDAGAVAKLMRELHGAGTENFVRSQIQHFLYNKAAALSWCAVLDALLRSTQSRGDDQRGSG